MTRSQRHVLSGIAIGLAWVLASGCFRTTVRSGHPPADAPPANDEKWHSGYLFGAAEASGPYELGRICPRGWAEVQTESDPIQGLLALITVGMYTPQTTTIVCAVPGGPEVPPREGYPPPPLPSASGYPAPQTSGYPPPAPPPGKL